MLSTALSILALSAYWVLMLVVTIWHFDKDENKSESFLVADRKIGWIRGAFTIAASWIWAPALLVSSQQAFQQGIPGMFWFTVPNILTLVVFGFLAVRIRALMPDGYTLPQYMRKRYDVKTHVAYLSMFLGLQICSVSVQILAGSAVLSHFLDLSQTSLAIILAMIFLSYSLISGLKASVRTDVLQLVFIVGVCCIVVPMVFWQEGAWGFFYSGLGGISGKFTNVLDKGVFLNFGIVMTIGLMAGPIGDQQHWQRAFSIKQGELKKAYFLSAVLFGIVPVMLSGLGFIAAGMQGAGLIKVLDPQLCGIDVVSTVFGPFILALFILMLLSGLASTGDSALCAASSLVAVDLYKGYISAQAEDKDLVFISRLSMVTVTVLAIGIALIPGIKILYLFLFYGTFRACDMMPTVLTLYRKDLTANGVFWGICISVIIGLPLFVIGAFLSKPLLSTAAALIVLFISSIVPILLRTKKA